MSRKPLNWEFTIIFFLVLFSGLYLIASPASAGEPVIFFSDLTSGPKTGGQDNKGVFVTIWGNNFGEERINSFITVGGNAVSDYPEWTDSRVCFQLGGEVTTGNIVIHTNDGSATGDIFTVRNNGQIYFVDIHSPNDPGTGTFSDPFRSPKTFYEMASPGDTCYFRSGTYSGTYGYSSGGGNFVVRVGDGPGFCAAGTEENPIAYVAYPNESVTFEAMSSPSFNFRVWSNVNPAWYVISKFTLRAYNQCVGSAGTGWRIVGNDCEGLTRTTELQAGAIGTNGESAKILGNKVHGGRTSSKMDHAIYPGGCPSGAGVEIGWNHVYDNNFARGPLISINHEGSRCSEGEYVSDIYIHDNMVDATNYPCRGISVFHLGYSSGEPVEPTAYIYNNVLINCGITDDLAAHPAIVHQNGHAEIYNNTFYNTRTYAISVYAYTSGSPSLPTLSTSIKNNIFHMRDSANQYIYIASNYINPLTISHNNYFGLGENTTDQEASVNADPLFINPQGGNLRIERDSPCRDAATSTVSEIVKTDFDGNIRPHNAIYDIGAFEYIDNQPSPNNTPAPPTGLQIIDNR